MRAAMEPAAGGKDRVYGIESLRALAALGVFYCHIPGYSLTSAQRLPWKLPELLATGAHGVDLFIVISGFCLAMPVMVRGAHLPLRTFYVRRACRLLPPYYAALAFAAAIAMSSLFARTVATRASVGDVLQHVLLLQTWTPSGPGRINGSFWSIALEAHLYMLFPVILFAWRRWGAATVVSAAAALSIAWCSVASLHAGALGSVYVLPARLVELDRKSTRLNSSHRH